MMIERLIHTSDGKLKLEFTPSFMTPGTRVRRSKNSGRPHSYPISIGDEGTILSGCERSGSLLGVGVIHVRMDKYPDSACLHYDGRFFEIITDE